MINPNGTSLDDKCKTKREATTNYQSFRSMFRVALIVLVATCATALTQQSLSCRSRLATYLNDDIKFNNKNGERRNGGTALFMGKLRNKQAELQRKMKLAKQQAAEKSESLPDGDEKKVRLSDEELKEINDRKRFDELLNSHTASISTESEGDTYLSQEQEEENIEAYRKGVDRFFEGDPAPSEAFEELVSIKSENAIGESAAKRMLPWLRNTNKSDFIVVLSEPREKSPEFYSTVNALSHELPKDILSKMVFINADTPAQNRRFLKKNNIADSGVRLFSDEKREWMQAYTALGENRWSMTLFILADGRIQKLVREFSQISASSVLQSAVKASEKRRL